MRKLATPGPRDRRFGITILEVLVALVLVSFILAGLLSLIRSTLRLTGTSVAISGSISTVSRAEAYVSDLFRVSKAVFGAIDVELPSGDVIECRLEGVADPANPIDPGRCIALLIPVVQDNATVQRIIDYDLSVLSVEPIEDRFNDAGIARGFDGSDTQALFEYRASRLCNPPAPEPPIVPCVPTSLGLDDIATRPAIDAEGFLLGGVSPTNAAGETVPTFRLAGDDAASRTLLMRFIVRADGPTGSPFAVRESAVALEVGVRGLSQAAE